VVPRIIKEGNRDFGKRKKRRGEWEGTAFLRLKSILHCIKKKDNKR